jgi:hypothetical protein
MKHATLMKVRAGQPLAVSPYWIFIADRSQQSNETLGIGVVQSLQGLHICFPTIQLHFIEAKATF